MIPELLEVAAQRDPYPPDEIAVSQANPCCAPAGCRPASTPTYRETRGTAPFQIRSSGDPLTPANPGPTQFTTTDTGLEAMPLAITTSELAPVSALLGTSNEVETTLPPVATPMVLGSCVRA